jgi:hypothetical protein
MARYGFSSETSSAISPKALLVFEIALRGVSNLRRTKRA